MATTSSPWDPFSSASFFFSSIFLLSFPERWVWGWNWENFWDHNSKWYQVIKPKTQPKRAGKHCCKQPTVPIYGSRCSNEGIMKQTMAQNSCLTYCWWFKLSQKRLYWSSFTAGWRLCFFYETKKVWFIRLYSKRESLKHPETKIVPENRPPPQKKIVHPLIGSKPEGWIHGMFFFLKNIYQDQLCSYIYDIPVPWICLGNTIGEFMDDTHTGKLTNAQPEMAYKWGSFSFKGIFRLQLCLGVYKSFREWFCELFLNLGWNFTPKRWKCRSVENFQHFPTAGGPLLVVVFGVIIAINACING